MGEDNPKTAPNPLTGSSPTLFPAYLPYKTQHHILTITQTMLEEACFGFGKKWLPQVLSNEKWDCPEAVELTKWTKTLAKHRNAIPLSAVNASQGELSNAVLFSTDRLRHAAVHRLPTSAGGIQTMILSAVELATMLNDTVRAAKMEQIHCELASIVKDMEVNKEFLESRLDDELKAVAEQRAELDRREQRAVATMLNDDKDYQMYVSSLLDKAVTGLATTVEEVPCAEPLRNTIGSAAIHDIPCNGKELADGFGVGDDDEEGALQSKVVVDVEHAGPSNSAEFCS